MKIKRFNWFLDLICQETVEAITLCPFGIYIRAEIPDMIVVQHEQIHWKQQIEMLVIPFYIWYGIETLLRGYNKISFEQEAYKNENNTNYLKIRKHYAWIKYLKRVL
jgi:hypothetical protein